MSVKEKIIKVRITPKEFEHYNGRLPTDDMELHTYCEKVMRFLKVAIDRENNRMTGGVWIEALAECDAVCEWKNDKTYSFVYITSCGYRTRIYKPSDERVKFCPFCGHKIKEVK